MPGIFRARPGDVAGVIADPSDARVSVFLEEFVDGGDESVGIGSVDCASFLDGFAAGSGASEAVHSDGKEELSGVGVLIKQIADDGVFVNCHCEPPFYIIY